MAQITNFQYTIQEAFAQCFYTVPDYQREYVWREKEVNQLLDDINEQVGAGNDRDYFIGTILVAPGVDSKHFEVIDGQQRLTTFFLLLNAIRHRLGDDPVSDYIAGLIKSSYVNDRGVLIPELKLDPRYENASEIITKLVEINGDPDTVRTGIASSGIKVYGSLGNLLDAYEVIYRYLVENYHETSELKRYWGYLGNRVLFIQITTDVSMALKIFETINERGVGLSPMDLVKNLLFTQVHKDDFNRLKDEWKRVTSPLEKNREKPLRFLRYFIMAKYKVANVRSDNIVREDEIYDWFTAKPNAAACGYAAEPFRFVRDLATAVDHYINFTKARGNDGEANLSMERLQRLTGGAFSQHYVLLLAAAPLPIRLFDHFVRQLESLLFYYIFTKTPTRDLEKLFSVWADELRLICSVPGEEQQSLHLDEFIESRFASNMKAKTAELHDALNRYTLSSMQRYRTRYLLARISQYVEAPFHQSTDIQSLQSYMVAEIEHILPETPQADLRSSWAAENPEANYDEFSQRLGNLTLLEKTLNIVASNSFFELKKEEYVKSRYYLTQSISQLTEVGVNTAVTRANRFLRSFDTWTAKDVLHRQQMLKDLVGRIWAIERLHGVQE